MTSPAAEGSETFKLCRARWPRPPGLRQLQAEGQLCPGSGEHRAAGTGILSQAGGRSAGALDALIGSSGGKLGLVRKLGGRGRGRERPEGE